MNAQLKPIEIQVLRRPSWRAYELVRQNERNRWILTNLDLLMQYYRATGDQMRLDGHWMPSEDPQAEFAVFADIQFESERAMYEEMKSEGFDDPYERSGE